MKKLAAWSSFEKLESYRDLFDSLKELSEIRSHLEKC